MKRAIAAVAALMLAVAMAVFAPAAVAREPLPVVPDGCVWTGGGLACGVGSDFNEPVAPEPAPVVEVVPEVVEPPGPDEPTAPVSEPVPAPEAPAPVEPPPAAPPAVEPPVTPPSCG